jgi:hypothetical protein
MAERQGLERRGGGLRACGLLHRMNFLVKNSVIKGGCALHKGIAAGTGHCPWMYGKLNKKHFETRHCLDSAGTTA